MNTLVNRVIELAKIQPEHLAIALKKERLTYAELAKKAAGIADALQRLNVRNGDRVCFSAVSKPEMAAVYLGIQMCGAIAVFLDKNSTAEIMESVYKEADSNFLLTDKPMKEYAANCNVISLKKVYQTAEAEKTDLDQYKISPKDETIAEILFTTGTTGKPKGVMLSYRAVYHILQNTVKGIGICPDERVLLPLPLNHSFALRVLRAVLYQGASLILQNGFTFAKDVENNVEQYQCTAMACVPASYEVMKGQMQDAFERVLGKMRYIEFGAGSLTIRQRKEITSLLPNVTIYNTWGSSESGGAIFCNVSEVVQNEKLIGALGKPLEGSVIIRVLNEEGNIVKGDQEHPGRMSLKGDMQMSGYWKNSEATKETLAEGWLLTGDMVYLQDDYVFMLGRADSIINVGGEKVSPIEVENVAGQYEKIKECACIGVKDPKEMLGQIPVLFVVPGTGYSEEELVKYLMGKIERYKIPQRFVKVEVLPRNRMQKLDRKELKRMWDSTNDMEDLLNPVIETILSRRSIRKFTEKEISDDQLQMILKCAYHAPSGHNMQSWRFTVLKKEKDIQKLKEAAREAAQHKKVNFYGFKNPKVMILVSNDRRNPDGCQDASCAAENIMLAAKSYGISSVWLNPLVTLRDEEPVKTVLDQFGVPENHIVWASVALGYAVSEGNLLKKKENVIKFV